MSLMDEPPVSVSTTPLRTMRGAALATMCATSSVNQTLGVRRWLCCCGDPGMVGRSKS